MHSGTELSAIVAFHHVRVACMATIGSASQPDVVRHDCSVIDIMAVPNSASDPVNALLSC